METRTEDIGRSIENNRSVWPSDECFTLSVLHLRGQSEEDRGKGKVKEKKENTGGGHIGVKRRE